MPTPVALRRLLPHVIDSVADNTADTTVLSNLGRVSDPLWFGAPAEGMWFSPPPRLPMAVAIGVVTAAHHLGISIRWCRAGFSTAGAETLAGHLSDAVDLLCARD